jgi:hypothetical protein
MAKLKFEETRFGKRLLNSVPRKRGRPRKEVITDSVPRKRGRPITAKAMEKQTVKMLADNVNSPAHYKAGGIETIDFIEAKRLGYNLGNVIKYVSRADHKGNKLEDLKKAQWYLNREIANMEKAK